MSAGLIYFFQTTENVEMQRLQSGLLKQGLGLRLYAELDALCAAVGAVGVTPVPPVVLLAADADMCCYAAQALREVAPETRVMALQPSVTEVSLLQGLGSGMDACWPQYAPVELIASAVCRLAGLADLPKPKQKGSIWRLVSRGWVVRAPCGAEVELTAAERAIVLALYHAPGRRASHDSLIRAIDGVESNGEAGGNGYAWESARRLSVLVSRLRRKFITAGTGNPIRSVRRVGYEIGVEFANQAVAVAPDAIVSDTAP